MKAARETWFDGQLDLDPSKLIFIDETGASTKMARLRGRSKRSERCRAGVPHGHWKTTTFTAGLRLDGLSAPMVLDGPMNGEAFLAYVEQILVLELTKGDIVVMDNRFSAFGTSTDREYPHNVPLHAQTFRECPAEALLRALSQVIDL